jgi:ATP phosphoribosyltransferase regulatory subunit
LNLSESFDVDLGDLPRLDYYTGLTFQIYLEGAGRRAGGGGRYDGLTSSFGVAEPAVGFVLDLEVLTDLVLAEGKDPIAGVLKITGKPAIASDFQDAITRRKLGECVLLNMGEVTGCH